MVLPVSLEPYTAARAFAGVVDRSDRGRIRVFGRDRASFLQGLLTNDISALGTGQGCYAAYLTPQGRMITDLWAYELGDSMLLVMGVDVKDRLLARLDQCIFTEDVQLIDSTEATSAVAIVGPQAAGAVAGFGFGVDADRLTSLSAHGNLTVEYLGQPAVITKVDDLGLLAYELAVPRPCAATLEDRLSRAGLIRVDPDIADMLRIEGGIPKFHRDMDEETIPLEAGIESRAISFTKGCYVGQEVIVRVLHRGHGRVARRLVGLTLQGTSVPSRGAEVHADGRQVGRVTSSCLSAALKRPIALAYAHRDFTEPGTALDVDRFPAVVTALPFVPERK